MRRRDASGQRARTRTLAAASGGTRYVPPWTRPVTIAEGPGACAADRAHDPEQRSSGALAQAAGARLEALSAARRDARPMLETDLVRRDLDSAPAARPRRPAQRDAAARSGLHTRRQLAERVGPAVPRPSPSSPRTRSAKVAGAEPDSRSAMPDVTPPRARPGRQRTEREPTAAPIAPKTVVHCRIAERKSRRTRYTRGVVLNRVNRCLSLSNGIPVTHRDAKLATHPCLARAVLRQLSEAWYRT